MKRKLPEKFFEQNQRAKTRKWKFFNLSQALWGAGNREFRYRLTANCSTIRHDKCNTKGSVMTALTVRLNQFDSAMLEDLVRNTGESKTALVIDGLRSLYNAMREEDRVTRLSAQEFDAFLHQLEEGEKDPQVLLARERLMNIKPVWED